MMKTSEWMIKEACLDIHLKNFFQFRFATRTEKFLMIVGLSCAILEGVLLPTVYLINGLITSVYIATENVR